MTWRELVNRPLVRRGFKWDGTKESVRGHLSDEEMEISQPRFFREGDKFTLLLKTLNGWTRVYPGWWIISVTWPETGKEIYGICPNVWQASYTLGAETDFDPVERNRR